MIAYATVGVLDLAASLAFYDAVLSALGYGRIHTGAHAVGYADAQRTSKLWVQEPYDGRPARAGNGIMIGFKAPSRAAVDAFHAAGLAHGGTCEGKPGLRDYGPDIYLAYLRDPVGNKISAVCYGPA